MSKPKIKENKKAVGKQGRTKLNLLKGFKNFWKKFVDPAVLMVVDLQLTNGDTELHVVQIKNDSFKLFNKRYIVNSEYMKFSRTLNMHVAKYHEGLSMPINQHININEMKEAIKKYVEDGTAESDVINNVDPVILEAFTTSTIVQKVFAGAEIDKIFNFLKLVGIITALISAITLLIVLGTSGLF